MTSSFITKTFFLLSCFVFICCNKSPQFEEQTIENGSESTSIVNTELIDFDENQLVDLIKLNFLEAYGGVEKERVLINSMALSQGFECDIDTNFTSTIVDPNDNFELVISGELKIRCDPNFMVYNDYFLYYTDRGSVGRSKSEDFEIEYDMNTTFDIGGNKNDNFYTFSCYTFRNLDFIQGLNPLQRIGGRISFDTNSCQFEFDENSLTEKNQFDVLLSLYNQNINFINDTVKVRGTINKESSNWILTLENGAKHTFE